jgi:hypothetical protein
MAGAFALQLFVPLRGQPVKAHAASGFALAPMGRHPPFQEDALQGRVEGALFGVQDIAGKLADALRNGIAVHWTALEDAENQHGQRTLRHRDLRHRNSIYRMPGAGVKGCAECFGILPACPIAHEPLRV